MDSFSTARALSGPGVLCLVLLATLAALLFGLSSTGTSAAEANPGKPDKPSDEPTSLTVFKTGYGTVTSGDEPKSIDCGVDCSEDYARGTDVTLFAGDGEGYIFTGWSSTDPGFSCDGTGPCTVNMNRSREVTATFTLQPEDPPPPPPEEGTCPDGEDGWVKVNVGAATSYGLSPYGPYDELGNSTTGLKTNDPSTGRVTVDLPDELPDGWSVDVCVKGAKQFVIEQGLKDGDSTRTFPQTSSGNPAAVSHFSYRHNPVPVKLNLVMEGTGGGDVVSEAPGIKCVDKRTAACTENAADFGFKEDVTLTATPAPDSAFIGWSQNCTPVEGTPTKCKTTMNEAKRVTATFLLLKIKVDEETVPVVDDGTGSVAAEPVLEDGVLKVVLTATPDYTPFNPNEDLDPDPADPDPATTPPRSRFVGWGNQDGNVPPSEMCKVGCTESNKTEPIPMADAMNLTAVFGEIEALMIQKTGTGNGAAEALNANWTEVDRPRVDLLDDHYVVDFEDYDKGVKVTLEADPDERSDFRGWSFTRGSANSTTRSALTTGRTTRANVPLWAESDCFDPDLGTCTVDVSGNRFVEAKFEPRSAPPPPPAGSYALSVSKGGTGTGIVTSSPAGINCGSDCDNNYANGTKVTLTAAPDSGSTFDGWGGACTNQTGTCQVTMNQARSVTATFTVNPVPPPPPPPPPPTTYSLSLSKAGSGTGTVTSGGGEISCLPNCVSQTAEYASGANVTLTASPSSGSSFTGWSGACSGSTKTCKVTMSKARSVTATFRRNESNPPPVKKAKLGLKAKASKRYLKPGQRTIVTLKVLNRGNGASQPTQLNYRMCRQMVPVRVLKTGPGVLGSASVRKAPRGTRSLNWRTNRISPGKARTVRVLMRAIRGSKGRVKCPATLKSGGRQVARKMTWFKIRDARPKRPPSVTG